MRISDWSSDVCSSDLLFGLLLLKLERLELAVCLHLLGCGLRLLQLSFGKLLVRLGNRGRFLAVALIAHRGGNLRRILNELVNDRIKVAGHVERFQSELEHRAGHLRTLLPCGERSEEHTSKRQALMSIR